jgi:argininosuccinate synthase
MDREVMRLRDGLIPEFARLIYCGFWFSPEMNMLRSMIEATQEGVTGTARLKLYKGSVSVTGRKSPNSLYNPDIVSFDSADGYNAKDAEGFIRLNALRLTLNRNLRIPAWQS